jgi:hypothetical protein
MGPFRRASVPGGPGRFASWGRDPMQIAPGAVDPSGTVHLEAIAMNPATLKEQIEKGEYEVDPVMVADAMLRRLHALRETQKECSNPRSGPAESVNTTSPEPSSTDPIQVKRVPKFRGPFALSSIFAMRAGTHAHSS